jgi:solute carrier family 35 protein F1/2
MNSRLVPLVLGQVCSLLLAICTLASSLLNSRGFSAPAVQNSLAYLVLSLRLLRRKTRVEYRLVYGLLALLDFQANYLLVRAFSLTSMTSGQVLASCTVPFVVFLRFLFVRTRYSLAQIAAVLGGILGTGLVIYSDFSLGNQQPSSTDPLLGNCLALLAAAIYACCNCLEEKLLEEKAPEMLGMLGLCGIFVGTIQAVLSGEISQQFISSFDNWVVGGLVVLYVSSLVGFYHLLSFYIARYDAVVFNLSILSASVYATLFESIIKGKFTLGQDWLYGAGFALILAGCFTYHSKSS